MKPHFLLPPIPEEQQSPLVRQLLDIIDQQANLIEQMAEQIQQLKDEIARLKKSATPAQNSAQPSGKKKGSKKHKSSFSHRRRSDRQRD